jgi:prepilin peptidase CpaA
MASVAVICDLRYQKIPNWLTFITFVLAVLYHSITHGLSGFLFAVEGGIVGILVLLLPYLMGGMGAGDAKFMGAIGGLLGPKGIFVAFLLTALTGGVYAVALLAFYGNLGQTLQRYRLILRTFFAMGKLMYLPPPPQQETVPRLRYGIAIAIGTIVTVVMKNNVYGMLNFD